ncbi:MAG TPA: 50S ribosomal protein L24 [Sulfurovum sp.]|nr:MAG: 50S ribosomal protein L24 [Sulfurovum sp. 35-42-20]OYZ24286.1 MAG: 50S ribosomal protein L24 [Sulfurovum sp. 16-42-52]OYZ49247.1 MAG: 50S ribosomal protein L24 [Sulfurovum sp. 24-42-9]OZA43794.1 MAG: 50S ribosomal protein L24 [Sulfurovum sp. 17-42-90]OZA60869.1 MAG: 50S ribosomal protein L24 [Sulfurovum sp. 39-42-12]HQR73010.1 50S ribosomal protein L24 [Sulfurovum sp.]
MAKTFKIKKGDQVMVIAGDDKGTVGEVIQVLTKKDAVIVAGCKMAKKAIKPSEENKDGGFANKEMPIHISNVKKVEG